MATIAIDELNNPSFDSEEFIEEYFKPMQISEDRKEERKEAARSFRDVLLFILSLIAVENQYSALNWAYIEEQFRMELEKAALNYARNTQALQDYIAEKASNFVGITREKDLSDPYWLSDERATMEAVNEANDVVGYEEWQQAIEDGYTHKIWKTERDMRVRKTHQKVEGKKIPIMDMFVVGDGLMRYPHDWYYNPKECYGCRCALQFTKDYDAENDESRKGAKGTVKETQINRKRLAHDVLTKRYAVLGEDEETTRILSDRTAEIMGHRNRTHYEDLAFVDTKAHTSKINKDFDYYDEEYKVSKCIPSKEMEYMLETTDSDKIIGLHNHPSSSVPSLADIVKAYERKYKYSLIVGHNGYIFKLRVKDLKEYALNSIDNRLADYETGLYNNNKEMLEEALKELKGYGVDIEVIP